MKKVLTFVAFFPMLNLAGFTLSFQLLVRSQKIPAIRDSLTKGTQKNPCTPTPDTFLFHGRIL
jgi:hypothetical protein